MDSFALAKDKAGQDVSGLKRSGINKRQYSVRAQQDGGFRGERASHDADANFADLVR
jgi:hypothetical protein